MNGFDTTKTIDLPVRATVKEMEATEMVTAAINDFIEKSGAGNGEQAAAVSPVGPNQKPRMLQLTAWIAHAGTPNLNDRAFVAEDLREAVERGLFQAPYFGMIDFNHDFESYGVWYSAEFAYDADAGQWGILAQGALFAWRYTELADKVLAMQARQGYIDVSMAAMAGYYEEARTPEGRHYMIVRKPVFFTTSLLDVDPADPKARALGSENPDESPEARTVELLRASLDGEENNSEEVLMDELMTRIEAALAEMNEEREEIVALIKAATEELPAARAELEAAAETVTALEARIAELEAVNAALLDEKAAAEKVTTEGELAARTVEVTLEAAKQELEAATARIAELEAFKAEIEERAAAEAAAAKREERMKQIPDAVMAALEEDEREEMIEMWMGQDDTAFTKTVKLFSIASAGRKSFVERSAEEGNLSTAADTNEGGIEFALIRKYRK
jgi:hypothetical protein